MQPRTLPSRLREHTTNPSGRDFVVGDLHGMRAALDRALERVNFDTAHDRLFGTGDLVDRGPDSLGCLALLSEPWFYGVLGNHERMLLAYLGEPETWLSRFHAGRYTRAWVRTLATSDLERLTNHLPQLVALPWARKIAPPAGAQTTDSPWYVMHADRWFEGRVLEDADLDRLLDQDTPPHRLKERMTWSRRLAGRALSMHLAPRLVDPLPCEPGVSLTYVGHTVVPRFLQHRSHVFVDCGAGVAALGKTAGDFILPLIEHRPEGWIVHA